ncbi:MAG TPA: arsenite methyltransferase [Thermoleophilaceae bacterium]|nr:arsenite methyltransferase [Thermoleophilaceae bacterium]
MADLTTAAAETSSCCSPAAQETCCEPGDKQACCGAAGEGGGCGCSAGREAAADTDVRETVRERYAAAARQAAGGTGVLADHEGSLFGASQYGCAERAGLPVLAELASLGCGNPTAVADLRLGETVLDLGSGGGIDVLLSADRVGQDGKAYGLDMTDEMLDLARANQAKAGVENVEWLKGTIEDVPLADASVDAVISNCVINLSTDKDRVFRESARVLRPGGRFAVTDIVADADMDEATRRDMEQWTGCIAGALTEDEFREALADAGLTDIEVRPTHRVHEHAASAIIRARKPGETSG